MTLSTAQANCDRLRTSEIRYRRLFEAARDGVLLVDPATRKITDANPFMLEYSHAQLVGKELFEIGLLKDESASQEKFWALRNSGEVRYEDLPLESADGRHHEVEVVANVYDEDGATVIQCNIRDITARKRRDAHKKLLLAEVNHRARNLLAVVQVIAQQTAKRGDHATFVSRLTERIAGLAASQDLLVESEWLGVGLKDLVRSQLAHFKDLFGERVRIDGPPVRLTSSAAQGLGMALHELGTNASKYGALSTDRGRVNISWHFDKEKTNFFMSWTEELGPAVSLPKSRGFGQKVLESMIESSVNGVVELGYPSTGFVWRLSAPVGRILESASSAHVGSNGRKS
jgi:PAS domain S-box-containing protein